MRREFLDRIAEAKLDEFIAHTYRCQQCADAAELYGEPRDLCTAGNRLHSGWTDAANDAAYFSAGQLQLL